MTTERQDDWSWRAWPRASRIRHMAIAVVLAVALVATGSALTLAGRAIMSPSPTTVALEPSTPLEQAPAIDTAKVTRQVDPAVVDVDTIASTPAGPTNVAGTGMIVTSNGYVVTNNHVVRGATEIKVTIPGHGGHYMASFVGADPASDVAVIRIIDAPRHLPTVSFANSAHLSVGESVLAIGNSLGLGGAPSVTAGIISALRRSITATSETGADAEHLRGMIESDTPIAPGNSGGPLVDATGEVVGMNTAASSIDRRLGSSVAFALPIDRVVALARALISGRHGPGLVFGRAAYLGIEGSTVALVAQSAKAAVNIVQVEPGTPAARLGLEPGDLILSVDGIPTTSMRQLSALIAARQPGDPVTIAFEAGGIDRTARVRLVAGPAA
jgi:S1-C subfamily serine protease